MNKSQAKAVVNALQKLSGAASTSVQVYTSMAAASKKLRAIHELLAVIFRHRPDLDKTQVTKKAFELSQATTLSVEKILEDWAILARRGEVLPFEAGKPDENKGD